MPPASERGFSVVEVMIVLGVIALLTVAAVLSFSSGRRSYRPEDAAFQFVNLMRLAQQRSLAERQSMRLVINRNTGRATLIDENTIAGGGNNEGDNIQGDDTLVKSETLFDTAEVSLNQPADLGLPPAPYDYAFAAFNNGVWTAHFESDGSVTALVGANRVPVSATFFFWTPNPQATDKPAIDTGVRAVTLFGASASVRYWKFNGQAFIAETV
jgi:prepilin-type N-terminal cleavage/methylation domain-containing protein